ncbi:hypothetical protein [Candidatus Poriferisocius sp.]|uniref:hypothetical protein n=1 Tax=Candidatus Poriferisocius sp. TaxID=3101276 RepID=UPI003B5BD724
MAQELVLDQADVQEEFFARGWTDGLPVVPPTGDLVGAMLDHAGVVAGDIVGTVPERSREVTAEKAAVNAVMAGCRPEYFPVVLAGLSAMFDPRFGCHTVVTSTGGAALCAVVSGPLTAELGFNSDRNALGPGNRANATVGRALRLVAMNVLGARSDSLDGSSLGHPGKFTMVIAEEPPPEGWPPLRVELGHGPGDTTVTVFPSEGPHQVANHLNGDPEGILLTFAAAMTNPATFGVGKKHQVLLVLGYEHRRILAEGGWTKQAVREFLAAHSRVTPEHLAAAGVLSEFTAQNDMTPDADGKLATVPGPDDIFLVTAGSAGAGWSAYIPNWAPAVHSVAVTRRVAAPGAGLPVV